MPEEAYSRPSKAERETRKGVPCLADSVPPLAAFTALLPGGTFRMPSGHYVYSLHLDGYGIAYVGKGWKDRAWQHVCNMHGIFAAALVGSRHPANNPVYSAIIAEMVKHNRKLTVRIAHEGLTASDALACERILIEHHGRVIDRSGPLFNLADGGPGVGRGYFAARRDFLDGVLPHVDNKRQRPSKRERTFLRDAFGRTQGAV